MVRLTEPANLCIHPLTILPGNGKKPPRSSVNRQIDPGFRRREFMIAHAPRSRKARRSQAYLLAVNDPLKSPVCVF